MFVAVVSDVSSDDHRLAVRQLLVQCGFNKVMKDLQESTSVTDTALTRLERDFDRATGFFDTIRLYQYPSQDTLVISSLKENRYGGWWYARE